MNQLKDLINNKMDSKRLKIYNDKLIELKNEFSEIQNMKEDKLDKLQKLIEKCNIFENYNLAYLKVLSEFENEERFKNILLKYEDSISEEKMNQIFPNTIEKISGYKKINSIFLELLNLSYSYDNINLEKNLRDFISKLNDSISNRYKINFQLLPSDNIELYLNIIYTIFCVNILKKLNYISKNNFISEKQEDMDFIKGKTKEIAQLIDKAKSFKDKESQEYKSLKTQIDFQIKELDIFEMVHNKNFKIYLKNFNYFFAKIQKDFNERFKSGIFVKDEDIMLFEKFVFFISSYDFDNIDFNYIYIWKESFKELPMNTIQEKIADINSNSSHLEKKCEMINNDIHLKIEYMTMVIKNFQQYSFNGLLQLINEKKNPKPIDSFDLIQFLKIQYFDKFMNENILTQKWKTFLYQIFESETIYSLINSTYEFINQIPKVDYKKMIDSVQFFNFNTYFYGETYSIFNVFISGIMGIRDNSPKEKISYYLKLLTTFLHELLGHVLVIIQRNLFDPKLSSPETKGALYSYSSNKRGHESGEYLHVKLFGKLLKILKPQEICYIFDVNNYSEDFSIFKEKFSKCINVNNYKIPSILEDLLNGINLTDLGDINLGIYLSDKKDEIVSIDIFEDNTITCNIPDFDL